MATDDDDSGYICHTLASLEKDKKAFYFDVNAEFWQDINEKNIVTLVGGSHGRKFVYISQVPTIAAITASVFTPFLANGDINLEVIPAYAQYLKDNGILDVVISGYIGEGALLNVCDRTALIQAWVDVATPLGIGVIVQIGALPFRDTLFLAKLCSDLSVKAILVLPESIHTPQTAEESVADLKLIADVAVGIPILYEDIPASNAVVDPIEIYLLAVVEIPCFVGLVTSIDTALNLKAVTSIADMLICISGSESIGSALTLQLNASICSAPNLFPALTLELQAAVESGDSEMASTLQEQLNVQIAAVVNLDGGEIDSAERSYITNQKAALNLIAGLEIYLPRLPLVQTAEDLVNEIVKRLTGLDVPLLKTVEDLVSSIV